MVRCPKISIIIPVYGVERYIERCSRSLFEQTLDNLEFIFVDDCTKDNSIGILYDVMNHYPLLKDYIKIVHHKENKGLPQARKSGVQIATGEYILHCDSDDWMASTMCEELYKKAKANNADIVVCDYYKSNGNSRVHVRVKDNMKLLPQGPVWNKLVKRSIYQQNAIEYPKDNKAEDGALITQLILLANNVIFIHQPLYYYFFNENSICNTNSESACLSKFYQERTNVDLRVDFLKKKGLLKRYEVDVLMWKYYALENLFPLLNDKKYFQMWISTYPGLFLKLLLSIKVPLGTKKCILLYMFKFGLLNSFKS